MIGGIIGTDIIRYDVYGKDILIANKMESSSEEGRILISETTKKIIDDHFDKFYTYSEKKVVEIKSINTTVIGHFLDIWCWLFLLFFYYILHNYINKKIIWMS